MQLLPHRWAISVSFPIVLDDPVSSLDFRWRDGVARRLVEEAKKRQVIVFVYGSTPFLQRSVQIEFPEPSFERHLEFLLELPITILEAFRPSCDYRALGSMGRMHQHLVHRMLAFRDTTDVDRSIVIVEKF